MRGRTLLVVFVALLCVSALPASAQNASAIASEHTTFGTGNQGEPGPTTLDNMSVTGTGDSASVTLDRVITDATADGFEDGNVAEYSGDTADFNVNSNTPVFSGSQSLKATTGSTDIISTSGLNAYPSQGNTTTAQIRVTDTGIFSATLAVHADGTGANSGLPDDGYVIQLKFGSDSVTLIERDGGSGVTKSSTGVGPGLSANEWYETRITYRNDGVVEAKIFDDSGTQIYSDTMTPTRDFSGNDGILFGSPNSHGSTSSTVVWDDVEVEGGATEALPRGRYVSAPHDAESVEQGWTNLTLQNATADVTWQEDADGDGSWANVTSTTVSSTQNLTQDLSGTTSDHWRVRVDIEKTGSDPVAEIHDEGLLFEASTPTLSDPDPTGQTGSYDGDVSIDVSDPDLGLAQGDSVVVEAVNDSGATIGSETVSTNGTVTFDYSAPPGQNDITWTLSDDYNNEITESQSFTTPATLRIYNESAPSQLVDDAGELRIRFFGDGGDVVTRSTTDGTVSLSGLPANDRFVVTVSDDNEKYYYRRIIISSLYEQSEIYLLPRNATANNVEFRLNDFTGGQFPPSETRLFVEAPIEKDFDEDGANETRYQTIFGDTFGSSGGFPAVLKTNERYRLRLTNEAGDTRVLGSYTATADVVEPLSVRGLSFDPPEGQGWATILTTSDEPRAATWKFMDPSGQTENLSVQITDDNGSVVYSDQVAGTVENYSVYDVSLQNDTQYTLNWSATRGGQQVGQTRPVGGSDIGIDIPLDADWLGTFGMITVVFALSLADVRKTTYVAMTAVALAGVLMALKAVNIFPPLWWLAAFIAAGAHLNTMQEPDL